jgi:REase_DpnII-MboI
LDAFYHVSLRKRNKIDDILEFDFKHEELMQRIITPYNQGQNFFCGGSSIDHSDIDRIRIYKSLKHSKLLLPEIKVRRKLGFKESQAQQAISDEQFLLNNDALEVTKDLLQLPTSYTAEAAIKDDRTFSTGDSIEWLENLLSKFHNIAMRLTQRHDNRATIMIEDEYDVQDLLASLLMLRFDDVRPEEATPSFAGRSAKIDFFLKEEGIVVEVKKTKNGLDHKRLGEQLIIDVNRYRVRKDCKRFVVFIYDPEGMIKNPNGLINDIESMSTNDFKVHVFLKP